MTDETLPPPEAMADFFDARVEGYDEHMRESVVGFDTYYRAVAAPVEATQSPVRILDLGCGTGLEIPALLEKAPNARIVGIDLSAGMLERLKTKDIAPNAASPDTDGPSSATLSLVQGSYLTLPFAEAGFDYVVAVMTLHHLLPEPKRALYARVRRLLKPGGIYIEGDYVVAPEKAADLIERYRRIVDELGEADAGSHHIDIPLSMATQQRLLAEAGFSDFTLIRQEGEAAIYRVRA